MGKILRTIGLLSAGSVLVPALNQARAEQTEKPNILLLLIDDMGYRDTGFTGSDFYETPVIDSLASRGMVFNQAYACAGNSAPSRSCLISGQFTPRNGVYAVYHTKRGPKEYMRLEPYPNESNLPLDCYTIAEAMRDAGYATGMVGKWHLGDSGHSPAMQGFMMAKEEKPQSMEEFKRTNDPKNMFSEVDTMIDFIEKSVDEGKPFFGYLPFHAVHTAWQARQDYVDYFSGKKPGKLHKQPLYAAMIRNLDDAIGKLVDKINELGISDNTIIIFTSDNGGVPKTSQAPLRGFKGCLYEGGIRVPMFFYCPARIQAGSTDLPVANVDFFPTVVDMAGGDIPEDKVLDGISLKGLLYGEKEMAERPVLYWHFPGYLDKPCPGGRDELFRQRPSTVMRKGDWKLTLYYEEWMLDGGWEARDTNHCTELYNLKDDMSETHDLSSECPEIRDAMLAEMLQWLRDNDVDMPTVKQQNSKTAER